MLLLGAPASSAEKGFCGEPHSGKESPLKSAKKRFVQMRNVPIDVHMTIFRLCLLPCLLFLGKVEGVVRLEE